MVKSYKVSTILGAEFHRHLNNITKKGTASEKKATLGTFTISFVLLISQLNRALLTVILLGLRQKDNVFLPTLSSLSLGVTPNEHWLEKTFCWR